jgi:hypothetical protein
VSYIGNEPTSVAFLTDTFSGNGSTTAFTLSAAPAGTSSILVAITGVVQDPSTYSVVGTTLTFSPAPPAGTGNISVRFLGIPASGVTTTAYRTVTEFTATAGQTTFNTPSYTPGFIDVYRNGVMLGSADYTASNGVSVVLASGATAGDLVEVISMQVSSVLNAIPSTAGSVSTANIADNAITTAKIAPGAVIAADIASGQTFALNGITFPSTQVPSANANTLDDYEEGTWTPTIRGESVNGTPVSGQGFYTKIGRFVYLSIRFENVARPGGGASGAIIIDVPFTLDTSVSNYSYPGVGLMVLFSGTSIANTYQSVRVNEGTPYFRVQYQTNLNLDYTNLVISDLGPSNNYIRFAFGYFIA